MEKQTLDCKGLACPMPVVNAKKILEENDQIELDVIVDNDIAVQNITKLANSMNAKSNTSKLQNGIYIVTINKEGKAPANLPEPSCEMTQEQTGKTILFKSEFLGLGNDDLGTILIKGFIFTLTQSKPYPKKIMFVNSGVKLTTVNEETVKNLKILEENGTQIVSCGTCLDFYNLKESLKVGSIGNMYDIVDSLNSTTNTLTI